MKSVIIRVVLGGLLAMILSAVSCTAVPVSDGNEGIASDFGNLEGRVLYRCNRKPATGYFVYLFPGSEGSAVARDICPIDENGGYRFTHLPPGSYRMTANTESDVKGLTYVHSWAEVSAGSTTIAPDILLSFCPDIILISPADGTVIITSHPAFAWEQYSGAVAYQVNVQSESGPVYRFPKYPPGTDKTVFTILEDLSPGNYKWYIKAYDDPSDLDVLGESCKWSFIVDDSQ